jgi:spore coat protein U-like protein
MQMDAAGLVPMPPATVSSAGAVCHIGARRESPRRRRICGAVVAAAVAVLTLWLGEGRADAACSIQIAATVSFGSYDVFSASPLYGNGTIRVRCLLEQNIHVSLGKKAADTFTARRMTSGSNVLLYALFQDAACGIVWGDGTGGSQYYHIPNPPNAQWTSLTVYGRVTAGQDVPAGSYSDTVVVTVLW